MDRTFMNCTALPFQGEESLRGGCMDNTVGGVDIAFVILHYKTDIDTVECITSIKRKIDTANYLIVVVDNASNNKSIERVEDIFFKDDKVLFVKNTENLGFARGMNSGIKKAIAHGARYIACINNDTVLLSNNIYSSLKKKSEGYAVVGPMIVTSDGYCDSHPVRDHLMTENEIDKQIRRNNRLIKMSNAHLIPLYSTCWNIKRRFKGKRATKMNCSDMVDIELHGSFFILTKEYFDKFEGLDPSTFLYVEESILYLHVMSNNMHTLYTPEIVIFHKEDSSTIKAMPNENRRVRMIAENENRSLLIYKELYEKYRDGNKRVLQ